MYWLLAASLISVPPPVISFSVGIPEHITLQVGVPTEIPAAIVNTSDAPLDFGCAQLACGSDFHPRVPFLMAGVLADAIPDTPSGPFLSYKEGPVGGFREQFIGLVLDPDARFDFILFTLTLNSDPMFPLHAGIAFTLSMWDKNVQSPFTHLTISGGDATVISPLIFKDVAQNVPDQGPPLLITIGLLTMALMLRRHGVTN